MFENEMREILNLVFEISNKTDLYVTYNYDSDTRTLGVMTHDKSFIVSEDKSLKRKAEECKDYLINLIHTGVINKQVEILKGLSSPEITECINDLLKELEKREDYILDYENPDMFLNRIEYHAAEGWLPWGRFTPAVGDGSDNLYCFFEEVSE